MEHQKEKENCVIGAANHDFYMQQVTQKSLNAFDDNRCFQRCI